MLASLVKLLLYVLLGYIIYQFIRFFQFVNKKKVHANPSKHSPGLMVKDEMCNTYLPKEDAVTERIEGKEYYFCSNDCKKKFLEVKKAL